MVTVAAGIHTEIDKLLAQFNQNSIVKFVYCRVNPATTITYHDN